MFKMEILIDKQNPDLTGINFKYDPLAGPPEQEIGSIIHFLTSGKLNKVIGISIMSELGEEVGSKILQEWEDIVNRDKNNYFTKPAVSAIDVFRRTG